MNAELFLIAIRALFGGGKTKAAPPSTHGLGTLQGQTSLTGESLFRGESRLRELKLKPHAQTVGALRPTIQAVGNEPLFNPLTSGSSGASPGTSQAGLKYRRKTF